MTYREVVVHSCLNANFTKSQIVNYMALIDAEHKKRTEQPVYGAEECEIQPGLSIEDLISELTDVALKYKSQIPTGGKP